MTKKSAPRRKRSAPASTGAKKKQTVAAKKKYVRELAKMARWSEIERLYGKKIVAKAKHYAETHVKKTPLEIAHEILVKNGYLPSAPDATTATPVVNLVMGTSTTGETLRVNGTARNTCISSSPKTLTKEQLMLIETRRQEALARRRRVQQAGRAHVYSPAVIQPDTAEDMRRSLYPTVVSTQGYHFPPPQALRLVEAVQPNSKTHRVVTPENIPTTNQVVETKQARPQCFWNDLEAAAEIVQWENEQMAEVTLEQPPATTATRFDQEFSTVQHEVRHHTELETASSRPPAIVSLSQELLAAAEIIQWEKEHEVSPEVPVFDKQGDSSGSDHELDAPQFQLLPVHVTDDFEHHNEELPHPHDNITSHHDPRRSNSRKRSLVAPLSSALQHSSAISNTAAKSSGEHQRNSTSSHSSLNQRDPTTEFIDKHLLEDKLEFPVLEFLDMMLA